MTASSNMVRIFLGKLFREPDCQHGAQAKSSHRYKGLGASVVDKDGTPDNNEQYWISCGDIEGAGRHSRAIYNDVINSKNAQLRDFIDLGKAVTDRFLEVFSAVLAIPPESEDYLTNLYSHTNNCGSHVRLLKCPPKPKDAKVSLQPQYVLVHHAVLTPLPR